MVSGAVIWDQTGCQHPQQQNEGVGGREEEELEEGQ